MSGAEKEMNEKMKVIRAETEEKINQLYDLAKKKKPAAFDGAGLAPMKNMAVKESFTLKLPPGDKKSFKINNIQWGQGDGDHSMFLAFARQDHFMGVFDVVKNRGVAANKAAWAQSIAIHPTKPIVLSGGMDNATTMWSWDPPGSNLKEKGKIIEHDGYISSLVFVENGDKFVSASGDADVRLFDTERRTSVVRLCGHKKDAQSISFADADKEKNVFATCSSDKSVKVWDLREKKCVASVTTDGELNACAMFPMPGTMIACGGEKDKTFLVCMRTMKEAQKYARNNMKTAACGFSQSGRHLYVGHDDGALITWDLFTSGENKTYASKIEAHTTKEKGTQNIDVSASRVQSIKISTKGHLATGGFDGKIKLWQTAA